MHFSPPNKTHDYTLLQLRYWLDCYYTAAAAAIAAAAAAHDDSACHILFSARQQRVLSSDGSSACQRWPFCNTAAAAVLSLAIVGEVESHNRDHEADDGSTYAKRTLMVAEKTRRRRVVEYSKRLDTDPLGPASRPRRTFSTDFHLPYFHRAKRPRKST